MKLTTRKSFEDWWEVENGKRLDKPKPWEYELAQDAYLAGCQFILTQWENYRNKLKERCLEL